jgi:purine-nucleoside/S-methyl-5'-thioadenosine phosphorylase / adenosine deaminase
MGRKRGSGEGNPRSGSRQRGSTGTYRKTGEKKALVASELREVPAPGAIPRFEIPSWRQRYGVVAGITGRGKEPGRGFDLGLWTKQPVGEVMDRWLAFRREMAEFGAVALGNQVHGAEIMSLDHGRGWIQVEGIDGWITTTPGILLTVTIADCIPIYLVAPGRGVALLHAGWRGTAAGILRRGLERLVAAAKCSPADIVMHCGIGICGECYEVGSEVMIGCGVPAEGPGPWHLDLRTRLGEQARELGLEQVSISPWCSAHDRPTFYSHRVSGGSDGRMVAYLGGAAGQRGGGAAPKKV